jgi:RimJ/RimL family protein N-acetyltransferase
VTERLRVREMTPKDVHLRIDYFHRSSDEHLRRMGVDRAKLPDPAAWRAAFDADYAVPLRHRATYALVWELDGTPVGFSTADRIVFGKEAFMHLHLVDPARRGRGLGAAFVRASAEHYLELFALERVFSEPNAFNVAANRALQRAGFSYVLSHESVPGPINFFQATTRWIFERQEVTGARG